MPALLPTAEYPIATAGFCWWYLANARSKKGASKVDPAPVSVIAGPLVAAWSDAEVLVLPAVVAVHAARASVMIAAAPALMVLVRAW